MPQSKKSTTKCDCQLKQINNTKKKKNLEKIAFLLSVV